MMKYFRMSYEEVVFKRSYINLLLLNAAIPGYKPVDEENGDEEENEQNTGTEIVHANNYFLNFM